MAIFRKLWLAFKPGSNTIFHQHYPSKNISICIALTLSVMIDVCLVSSRMAIHVRMVEVSWLLTSEKMPVLLIAKPSTLGDVSCPIILAWLLEVCVFLWVFKHCWYLSFASGYVVLRENHTTYIPLKGFFGFESVVESCGGDDYIAHCIHFHVVGVDNFSGGGGCISSSSCWHQVHEVCRSQLERLENKRNDGRHGQGW